ncbi:DsbA family oxidoreductase [Listeria fleischmannii]|uniref:DSBA-like thioredoxin domain-containing protein n=1 Tax=Listeria fleischmannii FSL S10-1203 TaxID=1265822 RepID=W7DLE3_9LIST|nr:DsbA family oxidoreductase [Listeria fleischmannii]EUJ53498.1 DSBA-like thioredoxin domain-containing protein [Listeria fleischmannii FSL S10-1203]
MEIEIWSDFACPFCYIGKTNLEKALDGRTDVNVTFRSFELDPNAPVQTDKNIHELLAEKYGKTVAEAKAMNESVENMARSAGLLFDFDHIQATNTFTAHRIAQYARTVGKENEFMAAGMAAYFTKGGHLNDEETLLKLAEEADLNLDKVKEIIQSDEYLAQVRVDETKAMEYGITSVPFFLIDGKYAISGAQPVESFVSVLERASGTKEDISKSQGPGCSDDSCSF